MAQIDENNVPAANQLRPDQRISYILPENKGLRVMFVGNSITCHGPSEALGWPHHWGMSASKKENDYVHKCMAHIQKTYPDATFCICHAGQWELNYRNAETVMDQFEAAREFGADVIFMRTVENCAKKELVTEEFMEKYGAFVDFLNSTGKAQIVISTSFWKHPADDAIRAFAAQRGYPLCELSDLGELAEMKAYGLFEHRGVAAHPGDLGMANIAQRLCETWEKAYQK